MATHTNRLSVNVNVGSPRDGHVPIYDETVRLWTTKSTSSFFPNLTIDQISGSIFANRTYTFPQNLRVSSSISASSISGSLGILYDGYITNLFGTNISASIISSSKVSTGDIINNNSYTINVFSTNISSSNITASSALVTSISASILSASNVNTNNVFTSFISSSAVTASNATITTISSTSVSSSIVTASDATITTIGSALVSASIISASTVNITNFTGVSVSSSIVSASNIFAETQSLMMLGIGTRTPQYPLDLKNNTVNGIRAMFGGDPTASVTIWDGNYQANHPLRAKLSDLDSSYFSISNKKPYGGVSDDEYYQFVNFLELSDYTGNDDEMIYVMTNKSTYNSPYSQSAGIVTFANLQDNLGGYVSSVFGNYNILRTFGVGTTTNTSTGLLGWTTVENGGRVNTGYGFRGLVQLQTNASIGTYYNFYGVTQLGTGGSISTLYGNYQTTAGDQANSSIGNYAGLVSTLGNITASNNTLLLLGRGIIPTGNYAIYNTSSYDNFIRGNVGIGIDTPQYKLHVNGDTNIGGNLTVTGLLTAVSTSIQYVTSSQLNVADNKIIVNTNDTLRFGGISVNDSGSASPTSGSLYWDSQRNHWLYENASGSSYNSAILIAGPKNTGALGDEQELSIGRLVYAVGTDHIDSAPARTDGSNIDVDNNLVVSGSLTVKITGSFEGLLSASTLDISGLTTFRQVLEKATITPTGINGSNNYDLLTQAVLFHTIDATGNWSINFRGNSTTTLNSMMKVGQSLTSVLIITNGSTPYNFTSHAIDGVTITPKWQHGEIPSYGVPNSVEVFSYNIIKLADATFSVLAARTVYS